MSQIKQIDNLEKALSKCIKKLCKRKDFNNVALWSGWGECQWCPDSDGYVPEWQEPPAIMIVGNNSEPKDDSRSREILLTVTLISCVSEGCDLHRDREVILDQELCNEKAIRALDESGAHYQARWAVSRGTGNNGELETSWQSSIEVDDHCYKC